MRVVTGTLVTTGVESGGLTAAGVVAGLVMAARGVPILVVAAETSMEVGAEMESTSMTTAAWGVVEDAVVKIGKLDAS